MKIVHGNSTSIIQESAEYFSLRTNALLKSKDSLNIALCGGRIVPPLAWELLKKEIQWQKLNFYMADERAVSPEDKESNYGLWDAQLFKHLKTKGFRDFCKPVYDKNGELNKNGKLLLKHIPEIDIILLSSGEDGHFASLFPNHPQLEQNSEGYIFEDNSPKPPSKRVSFSINKVNKTENIILFFMGKSKQNIFNDFIDGKQNNPKIPVSYLKNNENLIIFSTV